MLKVCADMNPGGDDEGASGGNNHYNKPPAPAISTKAFCLQRLSRKQCLASSAVEHQHEKAEIGIVLPPAEGSLLCRTENGTVESFRLEGPTIYFVPPCLLHQVKWEKAAEFLCAHVEECFWTGLDFVADVAKFAVGPAESAKRDLTVWQFASLFRLMWNDRTHEPSLVTLADGLMKKATSVLSGAVSGVIAIVGGLTPSQHERMDHYIDGQLDADLGTPVLAKVVGLSVPRFIQCLKVTTGVVPKEYVKRRRMERAHQLLATGDYRLGQVASAVGYRDADNFSRLFKAFFNLCPSTLIVSGRGQH